MSDAASPVTRPSPKLAIQNGSLACVRASNVPCTPSWKRPGSTPHASPKGLRHGFGAAAVTAGTPLNLVQNWLGHAQLSTTAIYADAVGAEEKDIARHMWG